MKKYAFFLILLLLGLSAQADVVEPGEVDINFKVVNLSKFPNYTFYYYYQTYSYNQGYQPGTLERKQLKQNEVGSGGSRGDKTYIEAVNASGEVVAKSDSEIGGKAFGQSSSVSYLLQMIEIEKVEGGKIQYKIVKTKKVKSGGKDKGESEFIPGFWDNNRWILYGLVPVMAAIGLFLLFIQRIGQSRRRLREQYSA